MRFTPLRTSGILAFLTAGLLPQAEAHIVECLPLGDGFFHNESGSSYDFFDSASNSVIVNRYYDGFSSSIQDRTGYLQFSLASLAPTDVIGSVTLNVYLEASHYLDDSPSAGFINHRADSSTANGLASQKLGGSELVVEIKDQALGWLTLDVTNYLKNDQSAGYAYACFSLDMNTAGYWDNSGFRITSADAAANAPYLSLTLVPEPANFSLLVMLFIGWSLASRRRRHG